MFDIHPPIPDTVRLDEIDRAEKDAEREVTYAQLQELRTISQNSEKEIRVLKKQLRIAKADSKSARKEARFSKITSIISILIALASFLYTILPSLSALF